jgi:hypothetical protein
MKRPIESDEAGRLYAFQHTISLGDASLGNKKFL